MPQTVYPKFSDLLLSLFLGTGTAPAKLYMGLAAGTTEIGTTDGGNPAHASGYARQIVTGTEKNGVLTFAPVSFPAFTAVPSPNGATNWFIADALTGGNIFFSGPLNPGPVTGTLAAAAQSGTGTITVPAGDASALVAGDVLMLGSLCAGNLEYVSAAGLASSDGTSTVVNVSALSHAHPSGEAFSRDGATRVYTVGFVETVSAAIALVQG